MTIKLLNDYRNIRREIDEIETELNCKHYAVDSVSTCTPPSYTAHSKRIEGYLPDGNTLSLLSKLSDLRAKRRAVDEWVDGIEDMEIRRIVLMRYVHGKKRKSWQCIAMRLGYCSENTPKNKLKKFLSDCGNCGF